MTRRRDGRAVALEVLGRVRRDGAYANLALGAAFERAPELAPVERGLATELTYGVLRHRRLLDHALSRHARRPLGRLDPPVLDTLRLAAYQLLMLERIPAYAAVDWAVRSIRRRHGKLAGFANAVLRRVSPDDLGRGLPDDPTLRLAVVRSLPDELARRWTEQLGHQEADALAAATNERPPLTARINALRPGELRASGRWAPDAVAIEGLDAPFASPSYRAGEWTAQDEASQLVGVALAPAPGERILDACCGVGGKATHLAAMMGDEGQVLCLDRSPRKLGLLAAHCRRLGVASCRPLAADLTRGLPLPDDATFDRVLLDAPCSGLGVLRRHPERKWRPLEASLVELQRRLLEALVPRVRRGGTLVYAVCTTTDEEGPAQARWLLARFSRLRLDPPAVAGLTDEGVVRLWPHRHGTDGFCIVRLRSLRSSG